MISSVVPSSVLSLSPKRTPSKFNDSLAIAQANDACTIFGNGPDPFRVPIYQGTDDRISPLYECKWGRLACPTDTFCMDWIGFEIDDTTFSAMHSKT
eukprot:14608114-Ditylum_brightwellii.AAC.1